MILDGIPLAELRPRLHIERKGGPIVGMTFLCPCCERVRLAVRFAPVSLDVLDPMALVAFQADSNESVFEAPFMDDGMWRYIMPRLTLAPQIIDASAHGHWRGIIRDGVCEGVEDGGEVQDRGEGSGDSQG